MQSQIVPKMFVNGYVLDTTRWTVVFRRCLPKNDFFQNNIRQIFLLKKKLPQKSTDVGPSNFFVSANHSLKRCKVVIVCTISNRAENDGPLKCLGCTMVAYE